MTVSPTARLVKGTDEITSILLAILAHKSLAAFSLGTRMSARHPPHHPPSPLPFPCLQLTVSRLHVLIKFVRPCARAGSLQGDPTLPAYLVQTMAFAAARWITAPRTRSHHRSHRGSTLIPPPPPPPPPHLLTIRTIPQHDGHNRLGL